MRRFLAGLLIVGVIGALVAANLARSPGSLAIDWRIAREAPVEVVAESPGRGEVVQTITAPGTVEAVDEAEIASQIIGRVIEVRVKSGDTVKKGDLLVKLDPTEAKARVDSVAAKSDRLRSAIESARADLEKARRDESQFTKLAGRGVATMTELADSRTAMSRADLALKMSANELVESEAMRLTGQQELERTAILAPIDGVISGLSVDVGEVVISGTTNLKGSVLMTVSDLKRLRVRAKVDESDVPNVRGGQPSRVYLQADDRAPVPGKVDRVAAKGTTEGEVVSFETLVDLAEGQTALRPGMSATVEIEVDRARDTLSVPVQSVVHRRRKDLPDTPELRAWSDRHAPSPGEKARESGLRYVKLVFLVDGNIARARPVETGLSDQQRVQITSGLAESDRIIVAPFRALDELKDGGAILPVATLTDDNRP